MDKKDYLELRKNLAANHSETMWIRYLFTDAVLAGIIYIAWAHNESVALKALTVPLTSIFMFRNFSLMHDAVHGAVSKKRAINDLLGVWSGIWSLLPFELWKKSHLEHHFWSGNLEKDPVMAVAVAVPRMPKAQQRFLTFFWQRWLPVIGLLQEVLFWKLCFKTVMKNPKPMSLVSFIAPIVAWGLVLGQSWSFALFNVLPATFLYLLFVEIVNLPHHMQMEEVTGDKKLPVWEQYLTARTCIYPKWFAHFVVLNFNYHAEHHMFPDLPWYHLPKIQQQLEGKLLNREAMDHNFEWNLVNRKKSIEEIVRKPVVETQKKEAS